MTRAAKTTVSSILAAWRKESSSTEAVVTGRPACRRAATAGELPGELESLLFCVQTGIGVGVIAFFLGRFVERKKQESIREKEQDK